VFIRVPIKFFGCGAAALCFLWQRLFGFSFLYSIFKKEGKRELCGEASLAVGGWFSPQPEVEYHRGHAGQYSQDSQKVINSGDDLRQPPDARPEIISQKNEERDQDEGAQEVEPEKPAYLDPHGPGAEKNGDPKTRNEAGDKNSLLPVVLEELPALFHAAFRYDFSKVVMVEDVLTPFFPDGVDGQVSPQDAQKTNRQHWVETDDP